MTTTIDGIDLEFATLDEIHETALARLDPGVRDFLEGGAGRRSRAAEPGGVRPVGVRAAHHERHRHARHLGAASSGSTWTSR